MRGSGTSLIRFERGNASLRNCQDASGWRSGRQLTRGAAERKRAEPAVGGDERVEIKENFENDGLQNGKSAKKSKMVMLQIGFLGVICENDNAPERRQGAIDPPPPPP